MTCPPKIFCPYCGLELKGNIHLNDVEAWNLFGCEYDSNVDDLKPKKEVDVNKAAISRLQKEIKKLECLILKRKDRKLYLEKMESNIDNTETMNK